MGPYAEVAELAAVLNITVTQANTPALQACLNAASTEIDQFLEGSDPVEFDPGLLHRTNLNRAVEWWKAPEAYSGGVGTQESGTMTQPTSGFERHAATLAILKTDWGIA